MDITTITVGPIDVNCYLVYCTEHRSALIVDPGDSPSKIIRAIEETGLKPRMVVTTHCHADHTGGVANLTGYFEIPFLCHRDDEWMLTDPEQAEMAKYLGLKVPPKNNTSLADGEVLTVCEHISLKVIHTPGHTPGGISLYGQGKLLVGDTLFRTSIGRSDLTGGNHEQLIRSIKERLFTLPDDTEVFPGHGEPTTIGYEKAHNPFLRQTEGYN